MAKLNHNKLKKYVAEYSELYLTSVEDAQAKMAEDGLTEEQIAEVCEAIENPKEEVKTEVKKIEGGETAHEEWITETIYKWEEDSRGERHAVRNKWGEHEFTIEKVKFIREVTITEAQASILNEQTINSKKGYYLKD